MVAGVIHQQTLSGAPPPLIALGGTGGSIAINNTPVRKYYEYILAASTPSKQLFFIPPEKTVEGATEFCQDDQVVAGETCRLGIMLATAQDGPAVSLSC